MNRRSFFRLLAVSPLAAVLPAAAAEERHITLNLDDSDWEKGTVRFAPHWGKCRYGDVAIDMRCHRSYRAGGWVDGPEVLQIFSVRA